MPLSQQDWQELRVSAERWEQGSVSREDWSNVCALVLIADGPVALAAIRAGGFKRFLSAAAPVYKGHGFEREDFKRIYRRLCAAAPTVQ